MHPMITRLWNFIKSCARALPILGPLAHCNTKHHAESFKEFAGTIVWSTATFWLTAIFLMAFISNKDKNYLDLLGKTVDSGQLFIFGVGMLGPMLMSAASDPDRNKKFPGRVSHVMFILVLGILAAGFYSMQLGAKGQSEQLFDNTFLFNASWVLAIIVVTLRYLTLVYRRSTQSFDPEAEMIEPTDEFAEQYARRRAGGVQ